MGMGEEQVRAAALQILGVCQALPRLVVFDLDYTLWPFWCTPGLAISNLYRCKRLSVFCLHSAFNLCECRSPTEKPSLYPQATGVLNALKDKGVSMAVASRTPTPDTAKVFLNKLGIASHFTAMEIYPSWTHKTEHFQKIQQKTGVPFKSMLFFDDEGRNIEAVSNMGVTSILVGNGVNLDALRTGLTNYSGSASLPDSSRQSRDV